MLSIIIVSYNVKYFLEQCLYSVNKASAGLAAEIIVVDNNSGDVSVEYLQKIFPAVKFICNKENAGYAKACNQGLQNASGEYILFLNPDTILSEDCLQQSINILKENKELGALGIHMVDGSGRFLPESKRGFPSPKASFFKLSGLIKLFPHSKTIAQYYLGHLPEKQNNEIDVLTGAYMMVKKEVLNKTGGFDERFFMYGEDIDLSYRIKLAGYKNYYLAGSSIIHFKGESTIKDIAYTKMFYKAMRIFVEKHYEKESWLFTAMVQLAIMVRGFFSFVGRIFSFSQPSKIINGELQTIIAGTAGETTVLTEKLNNQLIKRNIVIVNSLEKIDAALQLHKPREIIFCAGGISYKDIISFIEKKKLEVDYKFYAVNSNSIVGSTHKDNSGKAVVL